MARETYPEERFVERRVLHFAGTVPPETTIAVDGRILFDMVFELIRVKFYVGTNLNLRIVPFYVRLDSGGQRLSFIEFVEKGYLDGDDETMIFNIRIALKKNERVGVMATNATEGAGATNLYYNVNYEFLV